MGNYSASSLPPTLRAYNERRRRRIPVWMTNPDTLHRVTGVYEAYNAHMSLPNISEKFGISVPQIYIDIDRARTALRERWVNEIEDVVMEQVERRRSLIRKAQAEIEALHEHNVGVYPDKKAKAVADLIRVQAEQERAIEEMLTIRNRNGAVASERYSGSDGNSGPTVIVDVTGSSREAPALLSSPAEAIIDSENPEDSDDPADVEFYDDDLVIDIIDPDADVDAGTLSGGDAS
jgi:hypothetical protein